MISDAGRQLLALTEIAIHWLSDQQIARAVRGLMAIAGEPGEHIAQRQRQIDQGRADRELGPHGGDE